MSKLEMVGVDWVIDEVENLTDKVEHVIPSKYNEENRYLPESVTSIPGYIRYAVNPFVKFSICGYSGIFNSAGNFGSKNRAGFMALNGFDQFLLPTPSPNPALQVLRVCPVKLVEALSIVLICFAEYSYK